MPDRDDAGLDEDRHGEGLEHEGDLHENDDPSLVHAIGDHARVETEEQHTERAERGGEADVEGRVGQREDQPAFADVLHPGADEGDALTDKEETEVAVGECPQAVAPHAFGHCVKGRERMTLWVER